MMKGPFVLAILLYVFSLASSQVLPTSDQVTWHEQEIGVIIHFNMATYIDSDGCEPGEVPDVNLFNPILLNTDQWVSVMKDLGAKYAVLVAKHNCGFTTWPTKVAFPSYDFVYNYSVQYSPFKGDVVGQFVKSCAAEGIKTGFYYSVVINSFLNVVNERVQNTTLTPGQINVTQELYDQIVVAQLTELWTKYGSLDEIWFDGGYTSDLQNQLEKLLQLQPHAVVFNGFGLTSNSVRWIGTEMGVAPDPNWSTGTTNNGGDPDSPWWCPAECDTTLQQNDRWFWGRNTSLRSLPQMIDVYHDTVGHNCMLMLDLTPDRNGLIPAEYAARYKELGDFIRGCYGSSAGNVSGRGWIIELQFGGPTAVDRVMIQENQSMGQLIRMYQVRGILMDGSSITLSSGTSVGNKKIDLFSSAVNVKSLQLVVKAAIGTPNIKNFSAHLC